MVSDPITTLTCKGKMCIPQMVGEWLQKGCKEVACSLHGRRTLFTCLLHDETDGVYPRCGKSQLLLSRLRFPFVLNFSTVCELTSQHPCELCATRAITRRFLVQHRLANQARNSHPANSQLTPSQTLLQYA